MICYSCRYPENRYHDDCVGYAIDPSWCDCQHRNSHKNLGMSWSEGIDRVRESRLVLETQQHSTTNRQGRPPTEGTPPDRDS